MSDDTRHDGLTEVINLLAAPIAGGIRTVEQFKRGVDELLRAIDNVNRTMENLNETATRINGFLADIEEPVRSLLPQVTRTVKAVEQVPLQIDELMQRLGPLAQFAETAGGLFGMRRPAPEPAPPEPAPKKKPGTAAPTAKKRAAT